MTTPPCNETLWICFPHLVSLVIKFTVGSCFCAGRLGDNWRGGGALVSYILGSLYDLLIKTIFHVLYHSSLPCCYSFENAILWVEFNNYYKDRHMLFCMLGNFVVSLADKPKPISGCLRLYIQCNSYKHSMMKSENIDTSSSCPTVCSDTWYSISSGGDYYYL